MAFVILTNKPLLLPAAVLQLKRFDPRANHLLGRGLVVLRRVALGDVTYGVVLARALEIDYQNLLFRPYRSLLFPSLRQPATLAASRGLITLW